MCLSKPVALQNTFVKVANNINTVRSENKKVIFLLHTLNPLLTTLAQAPYDAFEM